MATEKYCQCHSDELDSLPKPLFRLVCHCKTCQAFFNAPFNDECTFLLNESARLNLKDIEFRGYQKGFSPIKRGICRACGKIAYCTAKFGPFAEFIMVPSERLKEAPIPAPVAHLYYHSRVSDIDDNVPKIHGHYRSQARIQMAVIKSLIQSK